MPIEHETLAVLKDVSAWLTHIDTKQQTLVELGKKITAPESELAKKTTPAAEPAKPTHTAEPVS